MGKGNPFKAITKVVGNAIEAPFNVASGIVKGDVNKVINGVAKGASAGTISYDKSGGGLFNVQDTVGSVVGGLTGTTALKDSIDNAQASAAAQEKTAAAALAQQQSEAKAAAISRRRADLTGDTQTIYTSALGDVANTAAGKTKKKTVLGG
nr:MAG TPA: hypothetical protein [Caudoviricetes sp.]